MDLLEFKRLLKDEFGENLNHATPENVRHFLDNMQFNVLGPELKGRIVLEEHASTYEEIVKDFFSKVLDLPKEEALMMLWLLSFDLVFSAIELQQADKFRSLFGDFE
jgi:hypothetical protein